jgi:hypothetical protein
MAGVGVKRAIEMKAFGGKLGALGNVNIIIKTTTGAPNTASKVGTLCWNVADSDAYICTVASGTWVKINA